MENDRKLCPLLKLEQQCRGDECAFFVGEVNIEGRYADTGEPAFEAESQMSNLCAVQILGIKAVFDHALEVARRKRVSDPQL